MKKKFYLIISPLILLTLFSCKQPNHQIDGIWEFKKGTAETYITHIIKDSISEYEKDSLIAEIKEHRLATEMSSIFEIKNGMICEGIWNDDIQKYSTVKTKNDKYKIDTMTLYSDYELMYNILGIDTLYNVYSESTNHVMLRYVNEDRIDRYTIYSPSDYHVEIIVITPLTRLKDKDKIEYFLYTDQK